MNDLQKLTNIKIVHTLIWLFFNVVLFYMAYAVIVNKIDKYVWLGIGLIAKYNKLIYTTFFILILCGILYRSLS